MYIPPCASRGACARSGSDLPNRTLGGEGRGNSESKIASRPPLRPLFFQRRFKLLRQFFFFEKFTRFLSFPSPTTAKNAPCNPSSEAPCCNRFYFPRQQQFEKKRKNHSRENRVETRGKTKNPPVHSQRAVEHQRVEANVEGWLEEGSPEIRQGDGKLLHLFIVQKQR